MRELQMAFISNQTTARLFRILGIIERKRIFTISDLAGQLQISSRTIANDIKYLKGYFGECAIFHSGSNGYFFKEVKLHDYNDRKQKLLESECFFPIIRNIFYGKLSRIDDLAHHYHLSESTFRRLINQCQVPLKSYGLAWESNPLTIKGSEMNLRKFFQDFYYEGSETPYSLIPDQVLHELFLNKLGSELPFHELETGSTPAAFYYSFFIMIKRVSQGHRISLPQALARRAYQGSSFPLLYSLKEEIQKIYGIQVPKEEFAWLYLITLCKRTVDQENKERMFSERFNMWPELSQLSYDYAKEWAIPEEQYEQIGVFLRSFFLSRKINDLITPVLNKEMSDIKESVIRYDRETFRKNYQFLKNNQTAISLSTEYLEDICVSFTRYSKMIFHAYAPVKTIYFLLEGDHLVCQFIRTRAIELFGQKHKLFFLSVYQLTKQGVSSTEIDLVVTNYNRYVLDYLGKTDYFLIKPVPDEQDWTHLVKKVNPYQTQLI